MHAAVGVTDNSWADFLRARPALAEANFWLPSGMGFRALSVGQPFLFKTHWPDNAIVGGGFFSGFDRLRVSEAWRFFGEGNGVSSPDELLARIRHYRREGPGHAASDPTIGCILLRNLFFADQGLEVPGPPDFGKPIVTWKRYDIGASEGAYVASALDSMLKNVRVDMSWGDDMAVELDWEARVHGDPRLVIPRVGQQAFKALVLASYQRHCAITGSKIAPVLEAAHIRPVSVGGHHRVDNGLLLRSDVHKLFDDGYLGLDTRYQLQVSRRLRDDFGNGDEFYAKQGAVIELPSRRSQRPSKEAVTWHMDTVFQTA